MTKHPTPPQKKTGVPFLSLALGAALAAGAGYYFTHKQEVDKSAMKKIDQLAKLFKEKRVVVEKRVKEVWGETSKEAIAVYMDLRGHLLHELEEANLQKRGKMLKEHYEKIVDNVIAKARATDLLTPEMEDKLADLFKMDWDQVQKILMGLMVQGVEKTAAAVRNIKVAGKVRAVRKTVKAAAKAGKKAVKAVKKVVSKKPAAKKPVAKKKGRR